MDELLAQQMNDFPALWKRIYQKELPKEKIDTDDLFKRFINEAHCSAVFYGNLAKMFPNPGRNILLSHAQDCRNRCRILRAEFFIASGISYQPDGVCNAINGRNAALRTAMLQARKQAKSYGEYAEKDIPEALRILCKTYSDECIKHSDEDKALLLECF